MSIKEVGGKAGEFSRKESKYWSQATKRPGNRKTKVDDVI